jgi:hypothetical protein
MAFTLTQLHLIGRRRTVLEAIRRGDDPARADVVAALDDIPGEPVPREIIDYVQRAYVRGTPRRTGPEISSDGIARKNAWNRTITMVCRRIELELRDTEQTRDVKARAIALAAAKFGISTRQVYRAMAATGELWPDSPSK